MALSHREYMRRWRKRHKNYDRDWMRLARGKPYEAVGNKPGHREILGVRVQVDLLKRFL